MITTRTHKNSLYHMMLFVDVICYIQCTAWLFDVCWCHSCYTVYSMIVWCLLTSFVWYSVQHDCSMFVDVIRLIQCTVWLFDVCWRHSFDTVYSMIVRCLLTSFVLYSVQHDCLMFVFLVSSCYIMW